MLFCYSFTVSEQLMLNLLVILINLIQDEHKSPLID